MKQAGISPSSPAVSSDGIAVQATELRGRMKDCAALVGRLGGVGKLMLRLHEAGDELSREELSAIAGSSRSIRWRCSSSSSAPPRISTRRGRSSSPSPQERAPEPVFP